jgi:hypothetical protein
MLDTALSSTQEEVEDIKVKVKFSPLQVLEALRVVRG